MRPVAAKGVLGSDWRLCDGGCGDGAAMHGYAVRLHARSSDLDAEILIVNAHADGRSQSRAVKSSDAVIDK